MKTSSIKLPIIGILVCLIVLIFSATVSAHVSVKPAEVATSSFQTFSVGAPNEKEIAYNKVKLLIPEGVGHVTPAVKAGWKISLEKSGEEVQSITWSGGNVPAGFREDFAFSAQAPSEATELQWRAYQTYADGLTVSWDLGPDEQPTNEDGSPDFSSSGPFSVTNVVAETESDSTIAEVEQAAADAKTTANRSIYVAIAGMALGLVAITLATRKK